MVRLAHGGRGGGGHRRPSFVLPHRVYIYIRGDVGQQGFEKERIERLAHTRGPSTTSRSGVEAADGGVCVCVCVCVDVHIKRDGSQLFWHWLGVRPAKFYIFIFIFSFGKEGGREVYLNGLVTSTLFTSFPSRLRRNPSFPSFCVSRTQHITPYSSPHSPTVHHTMLNCLLC
jgi:hypothetical protein